MQKPVENNDDPDMHSFPSLNCCSAHPSHSINLGKASPAPAAFLALALAGRVGCLPGIAAGSGGMDRETILRVTRSICTAAKLLLRAYMSVTSRCKAEADTLCGLNSRAWSVHGVCAHPAAARRRTRVTRCRGSAFEADAGAHQPIRAAALLRNQRVTQTHIAKKQHKVTATSRPSPPRVGPEVVLRHLGGAARRERPRHKAAARERLGRVEEERVRLAVALARALARGRLEVGLRWQRWRGGRGGGWVCEGGLAPVVAVLCGAVGGGVFFVHALIRLAAKRMRAPAVLPPNPSTRRAPLPRTSQSRDHSGAPGGSGGGAPAAISSERLQSVCVLRVQGSACQVRGSVGGVVVEVD